MSGPIDSWWVPTSCGRHHLRQHSTLIMRLGCHDEKGFRTQARRMGHQSKKRGSGTTKTPKVTAIGSSLSTPGGSGVGREDDCVALGLPRDQLSPRC